MLQVFSQCMLDDFFIQKVSSDILSQVLNASFCSSQSETSSTSQCPECFTTIAFLFQFSSSTLFQFFCAKSPVKHYFMFFQISQALHFSLIASPNYSPSSILIRCPNHLRLLSLQVFDMVNVKFNLIVVFLTLSQRVLHSILQRKLI